MYATFSASEKLANSSLMQVYIESLSESVWFDQVQITDVSEPVPVYLWLHHTVATRYREEGTSCFSLMC